MNKEKKLSLAVKILPFAFAFHNIEEALYVSSPKSPLQTLFTVSPIQFIVAVSLFTF